MVVFGERERDRERWGKGLIALSLTRPPGCQNSWKAGSESGWRRGQERRWVKLRRWRLRWLRELIT